MAGNVWQYKKRIETGRVCEWVKAKAECSEKTHKKISVARLFTIYRYYSFPDWK